ncbi:phosphoglycerate mutase family protein [Myxococcota bacterium]|nr:phosphoglycerate mutase family protein [Myxococcota bacterium]MCZ7619370.1 histidine phosphatase family protein [Myxococcota bacterium]
MSDPETPTPRHPEPGAISRREERLRLDAQVEIVLLRHGEPDWTPGGGLSVENARLTERGRRQAEAAAQRLAGSAIDAIYVSPLRRAQETAEPLAKIAGLTPVTIDGLAEIGLALRGLSQVEVDTYFHQAARRRLGEHWEGWPGGETFREFHARVTRTLAELLARHKVRRESEDEFTVWTLPPRRHRIVLVAHGGTNAVALTHLLDVPGVPWEWNRFELELTAYAVVQSRPVGMTGFVWCLQNFNEVDHLRAASLR